MVKSRSAGTYLLIRFKGVSNFVSVKVNELNDNKKK